MGTFGGHIAPGVFYLCFGLRWTYCIVCRYFLCRRELALAHGRSRKFQSSITFPVHCCPGIPLEAAIMLFTVVILIAAEVTAVHRRGYLEVGQHIVMYFFYGVAAFIIILKHYRYQMVPDLDYACSSLSYVVNVFLMYRHLMGKSTLEVQAHQNSMIVMTGAAVAFVLEMKYRHNAIPALLRAFCFSLHGSWLCMEDFMLWSPWGKWPNEDHQWVMLATISFGGHVAGHVLLMCLISFVALRRVMSLSPAQVSLDLDMEGLGQNHGMICKIAALSSEQNEYLLANSDDDV